MATQGNTSRFTFFFPEARVLGEAEIAALPPEKKQTAKSAGQQGVWLEIDCPDGDCISADGKITLPFSGADGERAKGLWLNLFCPEDSCELAQSTDVP